MATTMGDAEDEIKPLFSEDILVKFAQEPGWQFATYYYAHAVVKIFDEIVSVLTRSSEHLTTGVLNSVGVAQPRHVPMIYFTGLLISDFQPESSEVNETIEKMNELFTKVENESMKLLKNLKKLSAGIRSFTKSLVSEMSRRNYEKFSSGENNENEEDLFERPIFTKYPLQDILGVWIELTNPEKETLQLQCKEILNGRMITILAKDFPQDTAVKLGTSLLVEIQEIVQKAKTDLEEIELSHNALKDCKSTSADLVRSLKLIRKARNFSGSNCSSELKNTLSDMNWKLNVVIYNRIRDLKNQCIGILKGIQCLRNKTGKWGSDQAVGTTPEVMKHISPPRPTISKLLRCFQSAPDENAMDYVKMFSDIGNGIGESFVLEVAISGTMEEILFDGKMGVPDEPPCECLTLSKDETVPVTIAESGEQIVADLKKSDIDIDTNDEDIVISKLNSPNISPNEQSPISETTSRKNSQVEPVGVFAVSDKIKSNSVELSAAVAIESTPTVDPAENITTVDPVNPDFEDGVSTASDIFQSASSTFFDASEKSTKSEENHDDDPSISKASPDEGKSQKNHKSHQRKAKPRDQSFKPDF